MKRALSAAVVLLGGLACSASPSETRLDPVAPEVFVGSWRSVTEGLEFIRLTVHSKSSERGVLGARMTFSGVAWEGSGRIDADSLHAAMTLGVSPHATGTMVARSSDGGALRVRMQSTGANALDLAFVREN
jgi:hypothetical protein